MPYLSDEFRPFSSAATLLTLSIDRNQAIRRSSDRFNCAQTHSLPNEYIIHLQTISVNQRHSCFSAGLQLPIPCSASSLHFQKQKEGAAAIPVIRSSFYITLHSQATRF